MNTDYAKNNDNSYKINIIKHSGNEDNINSNNPNALTPHVRAPKRKKSNLQAKMENAYCTKKHINENGSRGALILKEFHKSKSFYCQTPKEAESNIENISNFEKNSKNDNKEKNISPEINHNINYNININNSNTNEILDLLKFTNNLYNKESHLQKEIPTKKLDINNLANFDKNLKNNLPKKKLFIQFGLNNQKRKSYKSAKYIPKDNKDKTNFSNYLKLKQKQSYENGEENKIDSSGYEENINIKKGNYTSKSTKNALFKFNSSKSKKNKIFKNKVIYEEFEGENEKEKSISRSKNTIKTNKESSKQIKKQLSKIKSEVKIEKSDSDNIIKNKKAKYKFKFFKCFCCLNSELNDST